MIAHECGHQAFSKWQSVNDAVGLVLHSALLVPYYSWYEQPPYHYAFCANLHWHSLVAALELALPRPELISYKYVCLSQEALSQTAPLQHRKR